MRAARLPRGAQLAKRTVDIAGSALALIVLSPILLGTMAAIKIESRGPVFFRQRRAGRYNEPFEVLKFRSMYEDAEERNAAINSIRYSKKRERRVGVALSQSASAGCTAPSLRTGEAGNCRRHSRISNAPREI